MFLFNALRFAIPRHTQKHVRVCLKRSYTMFVRMVTLHNWPRLNWSRVHAICFARIHLFSTHINHGCYVNWDRHKFVYFMWYPNNGIVYKAICAFDVNVYVRAFYGMPWSLRCPSIMEQLCIPCNFECYYTYASTCVCVSKNTSLIP